jgi:HK97 family phage major capsid protein
MHAKTRTALLKTLSTTGQSIFLPSPGDAFDKLLGLPVVINNSLPLPGVANATPILLGDFSQYTVAIGSTSISILKDRFAEFDISAMIPSLRCGSAGLVSGAIKALKLAAS